VQHARALQRSEDGVGLTLVISTVFKKLGEWLWPQFDPAKTKMLLGAALTRLKLHQNKSERKREKSAI
jgi:hypothetical protein